MAVCAGLGFPRFRPLSSPRSFSRRDRVLARAARRGGRSRGPCSLPLPLRVLILKAGVRPPRLLERTPGSGGRLAVASQRRESRRRRRQSGGNWPGVPARYGDREGEVRGTIALGGSAAEPKLPRSLLPPVQQAHSRSELPPSRGRGSWELGIFWTAAVCSNRRPHQVVTSSSL